jgi:heat shock protein HtpX
MASFFDEIARNRIKSIILLMLFCGLFSLIIFLLVVMLGGGIFAFALGIGLVLAYAVFSYYYGSKMVLKMSGAKPADRSKYPVLYEVVEGLASASLISMPAVYVIDTPNPNAFATGKNKKSASITVTTGLLSIMNKRELEGVIAHEMSHIYNNDIQYLLIATVFAGVIGLIAAGFRMMFFFGGIRGGRGFGYMEILAFIVGLIAPIFAMLLKLAISRKREYMADANGGRITRDPAGLASALKKIQAYTTSKSAQPVASANEITASLYFASPLSSKSLYNLFSTHPPIEERIKRLESMH